MVSTNLRVKNIQRYLADKIRWIQNIFSKNTKERSNVCTDRQTNWHWVISCSHPSGKCSNRFNSFFSLSFEWNVVRCASYAFCPQDIVSVLLSGVIFIWKTKICIVIFFTWKTEITVRLLSFGFCLRLHFHFKVFPHFVLFFSPALLRFQAKSLNYSSRPQCRATGLLAGSLVSLSLSGIYFWLIN